MDAVLFDLDGVLLEEGSLRAATGDPVVETATKEALADLGIADPPTEFLDATRWASYDDLIDAIETYGIDADPEEVWPIRERHLSDVERSCIRTGRRVPYDDVDAIDRLAETSLSLGVVSNARHSTVSCAVEHLPFDTASTAVRGQSSDPRDWYRRKPRPDYIHDVLEQTGAETGIYVGDSESDIVAADRAGIDSAFLRREHNRQIEIECSPTFEFDTLYDLIDVL